jgi:hypothetical protein
MGIIGNDASTVQAMLNYNELAWPVPSAPH